MKCANCGEEFDPADRASPDANDGSVDQIKYCSETCARSAENRRHYLAHRLKILANVKSLQHGERDKKKNRRRDDDDDDIC